MNLDSLNSVGLINANTDNSHNDMTSGNTDSNLDIIQDINAGDSSNNDIIIEDTNKDSSDTQDNSDSNSDSGSGSGFLKISKANNVGGHHRKIKVDHENQKIDAYDSQMKK